MSLQTVPIVEEVGSCLLSCPNCGSKVTMYELYRDIVFRDLSFINCLMIKCDKCGRTMKSTYNRGELRIPCIITLIKNWNGEIINSLEERLRRNDL